MSKRRSPGHLTVQQTARIASSGVDRPASTEGLHRQAWRNAESTKGHHHRRPLTVNSMLPATFLVLLSSSSKAGPVRRLQPMEEMKGARILAVDRPTASTSKA
ncbi:hypothetical protein Tdes44962_MAKER02718 [Teratosphaeria destructans]|uniref:Uncharacterized protein n=1 Tax=Teratosphaeria destructans TaxID=418781 RepID=A0A9W7W2V0_9PEZI|nr:hypothetical protein Tdes44962_MAKER02718 [Teratosphaeria destructans]